MFLTTTWKDFEVLDTGDGEKLERWGDVILRRPDPQTIWPKADPALWRQAQAWYHRSDKGGGEWEFFSRLPEKWVIAHEALRFYVRPTGFKHTGLFPEQAVNWDWFSELIKKAGRPINVLNLFAYTGGATVAALRAGASVCHVDASKGMVTWAKENVMSSGLGDRPVRYIVDDVVKFVRREGRRGRKYDAVIMDPPSYGRGPSGEVWKIEDELYPLIEECMAILSDEPLFFLINSYTTGLSAQILTNVLTLTLKAKYGGSVNSDEIGLPIEKSGLILPCGISGRWEMNK